MLKIILVLLFTVSSLATKCKKRVIHTLFILGFHGNIAKLLLDKTVEIAFANMKDI